METREAIEQLREALVGVKDAGHTVVNVEALERYLQDLERDADESIEMRKMRHQSQLAQYDADCKQRLELFKSVNDAGEKALNASMIMNGGAAVAVLSFLGSMLSKGGTGSLGVKLSEPLVAFGTGVFLGATSYGIRYFTQYAYARNWTKHGHVLNAISVLVAVFSFAMFIKGLYEAQASFMAYFSAPGR